MESKAKALGHPIHRMLIPFGLPSAASPLIVTVWA